LLALVVARVVEAVAVAIYAVGDVVHGSFGCLGLPRPAPEKPV
jgi:hypothetical protein